MDNTMTGNEVTTKDLALYYYESCPYCRKVLQYLDKNNLEIELKNTRSSRDNYEELKQLNRGITQVPCLVVKGKPMLESDDIIYYLRENFVNK